MKNFINYYYHFNIYDMHFSKEKYYFKNNGVSYILELCNDISFLNYYPSLQPELQNYFYFFEIMKNINNEYITFIDNKPYILLQVSNIYNNLISIFDMKSNFYIPVNSKNIALNHFPWTNLWENKIDYFEEWLMNKRDSCKKLLPLFYYFIGISENALQYLKETEKKEAKESTDQLVISHKRITIDYRLYDYYDPTNIIIDHASRDISEYIKSLFINKIWEIDYLVEYLSKNKFSNYGIRMLYSRILFPSFFFDYVEDMIQSEKDIDFLYLESRLEEFQTFIRDISLFFKDNYHIPIIPWIIKEM